MTLDEAINKWIVPAIKNTWNEKKCKEILEALEQELCEDCISRQAVNTLVDELARAISDERCCISRGRSTATIMQDILDLPPVTPQPKTGHWIDDEFGSKCSCCGIHTHLDKFDRPMKFKYCSMCGAKMEGKG